MHIHISVLECIDVKSDIGAPDAIVTYFLWITPEYQRSHPPEDHSSTLRVTRVIRWTRVMRQSLLIIPSPLTHLNA